MKMTKAMEEEFFKDWYKEHKEQLADLFVDRLVMPDPVLKPRYLSFVKGLFKKQMKLPNNSGYVALEDL
jgi:HSP90 family molecular chaperone